jgi:hypothetical protein
MSGIVTRALVVLGLIVLVLCLGCGPTLQVRTDYDHTVGFTQYRTFALGESKVLEKGAIAENSFVKDRIDRAIEQALTARGLALAAAEADLVVKYAAGARTVRELETAGVPPMVGPMWGPYPQDFWVTEHPEGTLIIDLTDRKTAKLLWRANIVAQGSGMTDAAFIQKAVTRAFATYPPPAK